jgi:hypothetical protein
VEADIGFKIVTKWADNINQSRVVQSKGENGNAKQKKKNQKQNLMDIKAYGVLGASIGAIALFSGMAMASGEALQLLVNDKATTARSPPTAGLLASCRCSPALFSSTWRYYFKLIFYVHPFYFQMRYIPFFEIVQARSKGNLKPMRR